jgi:hypothetical protein
MIMLRHALVLASFCLSFFVQPTLADAAHRSRERIVRLPPVTVTASAPSTQQTTRASWGDTLICAVAAYLPPVARYYNDVAAAAWRRTLEGARAFVRQVLDEYRRVMTEVQQHPAGPPPHV